MFEWKKRKQSGTDLQATRSRAGLKESLKQSPSFRPWPSATSTAPPRYHRHHPHLHAHSSSWLGAPEALFSVDINASRLATKDGPVLCLWVMLLTPRHISGCAEFSQNKAPAEQTPGASGLPGCWQSSTKYGTFSSKTHFKRQNWGVYT